MHVVEEVLGSNDNCRSQLCRVESTTLVADKLERQWLLEVCFDVED